MRKYVIVPALLGLLAALAFAAPATSDMTARAPEPAIAPAGSPTTLGPLSPIEQTPEMHALRSELGRAEASGDDSDVKAVHARIQGLYLANQPPTQDAAKSEPAPAPCGATWYGPDALISGSVAYSTAADYTMDGTMYAAAALTDSTARVFVSTDHGVTWNVLCGVQNSPRVRYSKVGLVVSEGDSARIFLFYLHPDNGGDVYVARFNLDGSGFLARPVLVGAADTIGDFAFCRDNDNRYYLYGTAYSTVHTSGTNGKMLRSTDYGLTWAVTVLFRHFNQVSYQNGAGKWQYLSTAVRLTDFQGQINTLTNHNYGDPASWFEKDIRPDTFYIEEPVFCPAFTTPETSAVAWLGYHQINASGSRNPISLLTCYTTDGGNTFTTPQAMPSDSGAGDVWPDLKPYRQPGNTYMNISYISLYNDFRRLYRCYSTATNPGVWSDTLRVTGRQPLRDQMRKPLLLYSTGSPGTGGGCVFVDYASMDSMFWNAPWMTGVAEQVAPDPPRRGSTPSLVRGTLRIEDRGQKTADRADLLDVSGRRVMELRTGANDVSRLAPGVYFVTRGSSFAAINRVVTAK